MVQLEDFQRVTINLHQHINMLDGKFNIYWKRGEKQKVRIIKWITCDTESDEDELANKYLPTEEEQNLHDRKNLETIDDMTFESNDEEFETIYLSTEER